jgi:hypothetical protein
VPILYSLLYTIHSETREDDDRVFELYKVNLCSRLWIATLEENFSVELLAPLAPGEIPNNHVWSEKLVVNNEVTA